MTSTAISLETEVFWQYKYNHDGMTLSKQNQQNSATEQS